MHGAPQRALGLWVNHGVMVLGQVCMPLSAQYINWMCISQAVEKIQAHALNDVVVCSGCSAALWCAHVQVQGSALEWHAEQLVPSLCSLLRAATGDALPSLAAWALTKPPGSS